MSAECVAAVALAVLLAVLFARRRARQQKAEAVLRALFDPGDQFIGKDIKHLTDQAGPSAFFGSMDHGRDVAQWRVGHLLAEAWFDAGVCTDVDVRRAGK